MTIKSKPNKAELELRRWCVQMAVAWPSHYSQHQGMSQYNYNEGNIIARAEQIYNWVNK